jgi:ssDNA-specific exonuclease RecJ
MLKTAYLESGSGNVVLKRLGKMTMPSRKQFVFVYQIVKQQAPFSLSPEIIAYFEKGGVSKAMLAFIVRVFTEVGLFGYEAGVVSLNKADEKVDFKTAPSYMSRESKVAVHEFLELHAADEILKYLIGD